MIESIFIKNFKKFDRKTIKIDQHNIFVGENDSGKSTILQALDIFFNQEKIDKVYVKSQGDPVEIGIRYNGNMYKKTYSTASYKLTNSSGNIDDLSNIKYIYIPTGKYDVTEMIQQLSIAKVLENTSQELINELKGISQESINQVISGVDRDLIVLNNETTSLVGKEKFSYNSSLKFGIESDGIAVEARGSGFQKNLLYALLIGNQYNNVVLGIDEIENSFSINNAKNYGDVKGYILVEGPYDLNWIKTSINLLGKSNDYIVLPSGGCGNINHLCKELESYNKKCYLIKDGDTNEEKSLSKECIELYAPLEAINEILDLDLNHVPVTKNEFFDATTIEGVRNSDTVKDKISKNINNYLTVDNPLISEIENLISGN